MINKQLKEARELLGLTQKEVCDKLNWPRIATLSEFENGRRGLSSKKVSILMEFYGVTTTDMSNVNAINSIFTKIDELYNIKITYK